MASYHITCTKHGIVGSQQHNHLVEIGTASGYRFSVSEVLSKLKSGDTFYTTGGGDEANVDPMRCRCGYTTLRTNADDTTADNLGDLPTCP